MSRVETWGREFEPRELFPLCCHTWVEEAWRVYVPFSSGSRGCLSEHLDVYAALCHIVGADNLLQMISHFLCWQPASAVTGKKKSQEVVRQLVAPSHPRQPNLESSKVKDITKTRRSKSLINLSRVSCLGGFSSTQQSGGGGLRHCWEEPPESLRSLPPLLLSGKKKSDTSWQPRLLCRCRAHRKEVCKVMQSWRCWSRF